MNAGFTVGNQIQVNRPNLVYHYVAFGSCGQQVARIDAEQLSEEQGQMPETDQLTETEQLQEKTLFFCETALLNI